VRLLSAFCACLVLNCLVLSSPLPIRAEELDAFIGTIDRVKQSIGAVTCAHAGGDRRIELGPVHGTVFFIDTHGVFLTAGHVIKGFVEVRENKNCEMPAVLVPVNKWAVEKLDLFALRFVPSDCKVDEAADVARCKTAEDPTTIDKIASKPAALVVEDDIQPDGTPVAFSGFPVNALIPYTARANIAGYQVTATGSQALQVFGIVLDKAVWPGASGGPLYREDGRVIGMMLQRGTGDTAGLAFARPGARINDFLNRP
jgi:S1-C subfamily serine protease